MFKDIKKPMQEGFLAMVKDQACLFITDIEKDVLWSTYLDSYKDATVKQEHNCTCCRHFIKNYGNIVAIINNKMVTIWDFVTTDEFSDVVKNMKALVGKSIIRDIFICDTKKLGTNSNIEKTEAGPITWEHFYLDLPNTFYHNSKTVSIDSVMGNARDSKNVFKRSLDEISLDSIQTVLELMSQNSLYRGEEHQPAVAAFLVHKKAYDKAKDKDLYCWANYKNGTARIRNTAIGTLLVDISEGKDLDVAVGAFERMVAPANYKRPTAIVTKRMIEEAEKTINELGYAESLGRRMATSEDIAIDNLIK